VRGGERAFVSRTSDATAAPVRVAPSVGSAFFHAAVAAGESLRSPRTRRALTRAGSFSVFSRGALFHALFAGTAADEDTSSPREICARRFREEKKSVHVSEKGERKREFTQTRDCVLVR
jgi:hypothetical protein